MSEDAMGVVREIMYITDQWKSRWGTPRKASCISADIRTCFDAIRQCILGDA